VSVVDELADAFEEANDALVSFARSCTEAQWRTMVPGENWPVGVVVHHCAVGHRLLLGWVESACRGEDIEDSGDTVDAANAVHAIASAEVDATETVELLDRNGAAVLSVLRALREDELARTVGFGPAGGAPFSVEQLAAAAARHGSTHFASIQAALGS
jgi:hypothetical protein